MSPSTHLGLRFSIASSGREYILTDNRNGTYGRKMPFREYREQSRDVSANVSAKHRWHVDRMSLSGAPNTQPSHTSARRCPCR